MQMETKKTAFCTKGLTFLVAALACFGLLGEQAYAQVTLSTSPYLENFDNIGSGLPTGWTVRTNANATSLGTTQNLITTPTAWNATAGNFRNVASATGLSAASDPTDQAASTNRALAVRQTGSFGDPGAAFTLQLDNTADKENFVLTFRLMSLDASPARGTIWLVQYGTGANPNSFTTLASNPDSLGTGNSTFSNTEVTVNFGNALNNITENVWIRIVTLSPTSNLGSRATSAIDDFSLSFTESGAVVSPTVLSLDTSGTFQSGQSVYQTTITLRDDFGIVREATQATTINYDFSANASVSGPQSSVIPQGSSSTSATFTLSVTGATQTVAFTASAQGLTSTSADLFVQGILPVLSVSPTSLDFGSVGLNTTSNLSLTLEFANLTQALELTAPAGYTLSADGTTFSSTLTLATTATSPATVAVRFIPTTFGEVSGILTIAAGSTSASVSLTGSGVNLPQTIFRETMGVVGGTTVFADHVAVGGFDNSGTLTFSTGTTDPVDVRATAISAGYTDAAGNGSSAGANIWFAAAGTRIFEIGSINTTAYENINLSFAFRKENAGALPALAVEWSADGTTWNEIQLQGLPADNASAGWYYLPEQELPIAANTSNLRLRWTKTGTIALRLDDVLLRGSELSAAILPTRIALDTVGSFAIGQATYTVTATLTDNNGVPRNVTTATVLSFEVAGDAQSTIPATLTVEQGQSTTTGTFIFSTTGNTTTAHLTASAMGLASTTITLQATGTDFNTPPSITITDISHDLGDPTNRVLHFVYTDNEQPVSTLTLSVVSSANASVIGVSNITLDNNGDGTASLTLVPQGVGISLITLEISDGIATSTATFTYGVSNRGTANTRFHHKVSDASAAVALDDEYMFVGDDEDQTIRLYSRTMSGDPIASFDFTGNLALTDLSGGVPREVDIEAATRVGNRIYWLGSHSNSAANANRPNRSRIFATDIVGSGTTATLQFVGYESTLKDQLISWDVNNMHGLGANYFGIQASVAAGAANFIPEDPQGRGFNIEGLCVKPGTQDTAYIGFRAPIVPAIARTRALIVPIHNLNGFATGQDLIAEFGAPIELDLGGRGIRSMANNGSEILIVAGPVSLNATAPLARDFRLYTWTGNPADAPQLRAADLTGTGPEAIVSLPAMLTSTTAVHLLSDDGDTEWYNDGEISKTHPIVNLRKFRSDIVVLGDTVSTGNPLPAVISVSPDNFAPTNATVTITVEGTGFINTSVVRFNSTDLVTNYVTTTTLTAEIPAALAQVPTFASITIFNPAPQGGTSGSVTLTIEALRLNGLALNNSGDTVRVTFDETSDFANVGQINEAVFSLTPQNGQLDSRAWAFDIESATMDFGGSFNGGGVFAGGSLPTGLSAAFIVTTGTVENRALGFQPTGGSLTPGWITLRLLNNSAETISFLSVAYRVYVFNDAERNNFFNFAHSADDITYTDVPSLDLASPGPSDPNPEWVANDRSTVLQVNIAPGSFYYLRWNTGDIAGGGTRDEFALDDIFVVPNPPPSLTLFSVSPEEVEPTGNPATITLTGLAFKPASVVRFNGIDLATTYISSTTLTAVIPGTITAQTTSGNITVFNPAPDNDESEAIEFFIRQFRANGLVLPQLGSAVTVNFDETSDFANVGQINEAVFSLTPQNGQLDSRAWELNVGGGFMNFGGSFNAGGVFAGGNLPSGISVTNVLPNNRALAFQPTGSVLAPGFITLRLLNTSGQRITKLGVAYNVYVFNDRDRSNSFNLLVSSDNVNFEQITALDIASPGPADPNPEWVANPRSIELDVDIPAGDFYYLRWRTADISGGGQRDEFALDDIVITPNPAPTMLIGNTQTLSTGNGTANYSVEVITSRDGVNPAAVNEPTTVRVEVGGDIEADRRVVLLAFPAGRSSGSVQFTLSTTATAQPATFTIEAVAGMTLGSTTLSVTVPEFQEPVASELAFTAGVPQNVNINAAFASIAVQVRDQFGVAFATTSNITLTLTNGASTLSFTESVAGNTATFSGVQLATTGIWTVEASLSGLPTLTGSLEVDAFGTQTLALTSNWNTVSSYIQATNPAFAGITAPIASSFVLAKNNAGAVYAPILGVTSLQNWNTLQGYQMFLTSNENLVLEGIRVAENTPIPLNIGWNLVSYLRAAPSTPEQAFANVPGLILARNGAGDIYFPAFGVSSLTQVVPGQGYFIFTTQGGSFSYPTGTKMAAQEPLSMPAAQFESNSDNFASLLVKVNADDGAVVSIVNEQGDYVVEAEVRNNYAIVPLWGQNSIEPRNTELREGESMTLVLRQLHGGETTLSPSVIKSLLTNRETELRYRSGEVLFVEAAEQAATAQPSLRVFPNPTAEQAIVEMALPTQRHLTVKLFNALGQEVRSIFAGETSHLKANVTVTGLPSGAYRVVVFIGDEIISLPLNVVK